MSAAQIAELRKRIIASIGECKAALLKADNDLDEAFNNLKHQKLSRIVSVTGYDIEQAFEMYQKVNGDEEKTISRLLFLKDSGEWEKKNRPNIKRFYKRNSKMQFYI